MVEPRLPELPDQLIDLGLVATAARALDVVHPAQSPGSHQIGNHGDHRTLTNKAAGMRPAAPLWRTSVARKLAKGTDAIERSAPRTIYREPSIGVDRIHRTKINKWRRVFWANLVEPKVPNLPDNLVNLGLFATATKALDVAHLLLSAS
jgi:hypothetical protein